MLWLINAFLLLKTKRFISMPKQKTKQNKAFSFFPSFFFSFSFFGMHLIFIFNFEFEGLDYFQLPTYCYLDLEHKINFFKQKMMYREKKIRKKKHFIMSQYLQEKVQKLLLFSKNIWGLILS